MAHGAAGLADMIIAHAGHWIAGFLYLTPVLIVVGALVFQSWRDKRRGSPDDGGDPDAWSDGG